MQSAKTIALPSTIAGQNVYTQALWVTAFAALTALGAQIEIPHYPVPYTLQTFFVLLSGALLGKRNGAISQGLYLLAGLAGLPVFSGFSFGLARMLGPTGGYLLAFPVAAFAVGYLFQQSRRWYWTLSTMIVGVFIIFSLGTLQLQFAYFHDWSKSISSGFLIFSWWDCLKVGAATLIAHRMAKKWNIPRA